MLIFALTGRVWFFCWFQFISLLSFKLLSLSKNIVYVMLTLSHFSLYHIDSVGWHWVLQRRHGSCHLIYEYDKTNLSGNVYQTSKHISNRDRNRQPNDMWQRNVWGRDNGKDVVISWSVIKVTTDEHTSSRSRLIVYIWSLHNVHSMKGWREY